MSDPADDNDAEIPEALLVEPVYSRLELVLFVVIGGSFAAFAGLVWLLTKANVLGESKKDVAGHELVEFAVVACFAGAAIALAVGAFFACAEATKPRPSSEIQANLQKLTEARQSMVRMTEAGLDPTAGLGTLAESWDKVRRSTVMFVVAIALSLGGLAAAVASDGVEAENPDSPTTSDEPVTTDPTTATTTPTSSTG